MYLKRMREKREMEGGDDRKGDGKDEKGEEMIRIIVQKNP